jgi:hypothetical protein
MPLPDYGLQSIRKHNMIAKNAIYLYLSVRKIDNIFSPRRTGPELNLMGFHNGAFHKTYSSSEI